MSAHHSTRRRDLVYFIQVGEDGPIKIGRTDGDPRRRLKSLQNASPFPLRLLKAVPNDGQSRERRLHRMFAHLHLRGEWFRPTADLMGLIETLPGGGLGRTRPTRRRTSETKDLLAFECLHGRGKSRIEIQDELNISRATYYRRLAQMRQMKKRYPMGTSA